MPPFPAELRAAIERRLEGISRKRLALRAAAMSEAYRTGASSAAVVQVAEDLAAYLAVRMPATFAAIAAVFAEIARIMPEFAPRSVLDLGAGPGTASFAALATWPQIESVTMADASAAFLAAARELASASVAPALRGAVFIESDIARDEDGLPPADLIIAAYTLAELPEEGAGRVAQSLARECRVLAFVEPGTPAGFRRIRLARRELLARGLSVIAPCPHDLECPISEPDWCHFARRLARSRDHRIIKEAAVPFEDEKFSYVAVSRTPASARPAARLLRPPRVSKASWAGRLCMAGRAIDCTLGRQDPDYRRLRKAAWGDPIDAPPARIRGDRA